MSPMGQCHAPDRFGQREAYRQRKASSARSRGRGTPTSSWQHVGPSAVSPQHNACYVVRAAGAAHKIEAAQTP
jgi:hypothetical protein